MSQGSVFRDEYLTLEQAHEKSGRPLKTLRRAIRQKDDPIKGLPAYELGGTPAKPALILVKKSDLVRYLARTPAGYENDGYNEEQRRIRSLAESLSPLGEYPRNTRFGKQVRKQEWNKRYLASFVADQLIKENMEIFIADGSTGLWLMLAILELKREVRVSTNNAAVGMEYIHANRSGSRVFGAPGEYDAEYAGIYGPEACEFARQSSVSDRYTIMPVTGFSATHGPCAGYKGARGIKKATIPVARETVVILTADKMGNTEAPVFEQDPHSRQPSWLAVVSGSRRMTIFCEKCEEGEQKEAFDREWAALEKLERGHRQLRCIPVQIPKARLF